MSDESDNARLIESVARLTESTSESDKLLNLLSQAADIYRKSLEVEQMKAEHGYDLSQKNFEVRKEEFDQLIKFERQKFIYKFWALVGFTLVFMGMAFLVVFKADTSDQRVLVLAQAVMIALALIGGKGIASLFDKRSGGDR